jgi:NADP-dependent alcohol dehydrogenase
LKLKGKLAQYGKRIFNLTGTGMKSPNRAIKQNRCVFHTMGMDTKLSDYTKRSSTIQQIYSGSHVLKKESWLGLGEKQNITLEK